MVYVVGGMAYNERNELVGVEEIGHLDFDPDLEKEEEPEEGKNHWIDPIDPNRRWCGEPAPAGTFTGNGISFVEEITCHKCLHKYIEKGWKWWWQVHNLYYGSTCSPGAHVCGR